MQPVVGASGSRFSPIVVGLAVAIIGLLGCGGVLLALLLPAVQAAREAARRAQCANNLKQIGLALHNYHDVYGTFPPAYIPDENGQPKHSWRVLILPFLERQDLYQMYNFDEPWNSPNNAQLADRMPEVFRCPSDPISVNSPAYLAISGAETVFNNGEGSVISDINDGLSNTIMVAEVAGANINWLEPRDLDVTTMSRAINASQDGDAISSYHPGGAQVLFADGSVRFLSDTMDAASVDALLLRSDGKLATDF